MSRKIILDTDIGTDIDDVFALLLALRSPELELCAVTTVSGDAKLRAAIARKVLELEGRLDIPLAAGLDKQINGAPIKLGGWEGKGFLDEQDLKDRQFDDACDVLVDTIEQNAGEIELVTIGPLTNIGNLLSKYPDVQSKIKAITLMGGVIARADWPAKSEYNLNADPQAAKIVFSSGLPVTMVGLDVTLDVRLEASEIAKLKKKQTPLMQGVCAMLDIWLAEIKDTKTCMHDPLTVAYLIDECILETRRKHVAVRMVDDTLRTVIDASSPDSINVAEVVDVEGFKKLFALRVLK